MLNIPNLSRLLQKTKHVVIPERAPPVGGLGIGNPVFINLIFFLSRLQCEKPYSQGIVPDCSFYQFFCIKYQYVATLY